MNGYNDKTYPTLKQIAQGATGCYQKINDPKLGTYYVGPCQCGFKSQKKLNNDSCDDPSTFCRISNFSNYITPCPNSSTSCQSTKQGGTCDSNCITPGCSTDSPQNCVCQNNPDSDECKWLDSSDNRVVGTMAICVNPSDIVAKMISLSTNISDWSPEPTPPLSIIISALGIIGILISVVWYILFLIRKERKMLK